MSEAGPTHLHWHAERLWQQLQPVLPGLSVEVVARCDSTNTRLIERARAASGDPEAPVTRPGELDDTAAATGTPHGRRGGDLEPCLLVAEQQTHGRGRLGRQWQSVPGDSLTFSLALALAPRDWSGLSLAVGLALAEALQPPGSAVTGPPLMLKWPNDLWLADGAGGGRKLGGILIETVSVGRRRMAVVGVGLNVAPPPAAGLAEPAACLRELEPALTPPEVLARVALPLAQALKDFERAGFAPLRAAYARRDLLAGRAVTTRSDNMAAAEGAPAQGVAEGVDDQGALLLRTPQGLQRIVSGEVGVRPLRDAAAAPAKVNPGA